jgi:hypothetical protein
MGNINVTVPAPFPPERFVHALTDFSDNREKYWGNSQNGYLKVHELGDTWADVTEGSKAGGGIWQRYRYDWSKPNEVHLEVLESNAFGKGSFWHYTLTPDGNGGSSINLRIHRVPTSVKGRLTDALLLLVGNQIFGKDLRKSVAKIQEAG